MTSVNDTTIDQSVAERRVFGERFEVLEQIGSGGMATVYRGRDTTLQRDVAIKVLHPHLAVRADARKRFNREAHAIARIKHPNVVDVYDFSGGEDQEAFLVGEFVDGTTLSDWYRRHGPLFPQSAALIAYAIAGALKHAHSMGIVHRDIKPDNLMISRTGELKLMDFGIATVMDLEGMTATGAIIGSPAHMAPEQIEGGEVDERVDVFAFGTVLYYLCCGELPFVAGNPHALFRLILECTYDPATLVSPMVDRRMGELIDGCMQHNPEERISSMARLQEALDNYLRYYQITEPDRALRDLLSTPEQVQHRWRPMMVETLCAEGRQQAREGSLALAIDAYNRALAFDAEAPEAKAGLSDLTSRSRRRRRVRVALAAVAGGVMALSSWYALSHRPQPARPSQQPAKPNQQPMAAIQPVLLPESPELKERVKQAVKKTTKAPAPAPEAKRPEEPETVVAEKVAEAPLPAKGTAKPTVKSGLKAKGVAKRRERKTEKRASTAAGGASEENAPRPKPTMPVRLGSLPPSAKIALDGDILTRDGSTKTRLEMGRTYTLTCIASERLIERCPDCEQRKQLRFRVPTIAPPSGIFSKKCDFTSCCPKSAFGLPR